MRSIDPVLLSKIKEQNQTIYNNANPKMSIQVSRAKDTVMDSTYWTTEIIREKEGIGDLSVAARRQKPYGRPNRLYNIYVDNGTVKTSIREYPDYQNLKWQYQFDVGTGTACAIAFDGFWELYRNKWQMVTSEKPWIFWVDTVGKLWCQVWDEEATRTELVAAGVTKVKSIRGWRNINMPLVDQGVVAGYIKTDGKVYYRNYCYQSTGEYVWETEKQITEFTGTAINLNLFITNDYRMGFVIEDSTGKIHLYVTERAWAGMAIAPEKIYANPYEIHLDLIDLDYENTYEDIHIQANPYDIKLDLLFGSTENSILSAENKPIVMLDENEEEYDDWGWVIEFEVQNPIPELLLEKIVVTDTSNSSTIPIASIEDLGDNKYRLLASDVIESGFNNILGDIRVDITGVYNEAGYEYESMSYTFTPANLVPTDIPVPEVVEVWNE